MEITQKISVGSLVELQGDEMAGVLWKLVRAQLIDPYLQIDLKSFDLSLENRDKTSNKVTDEAIEAINKIKLVVKCPTITPTKEHKLKEVWECASNKIMNHIGGTSFTECLELKKVPKLVPGWQKQIVLARHCFGDQYKAVEFQPTGGKFEIVFEGQSGKVTRLNVFDFKKGGGVAMAFYNTDE
jgi:isocitrate dehydrogenase